MASATGKIILSGEYAVVFGKRGIAIPSEKRINTMFTASQKNDESTIHWNEKSEDDSWVIYAKKIAECIREHSGLSGAFQINHDLPLGKGMGASTALIIAMCRAALGPDCAKIALSIENELNVGNSGIDFAVIWEEKPILFQRKSIPEMIDIDLQKLAGYELIDTGMPSEPTPELVAWVKEKYMSDAHDPPSAAGTQRRSSEVDAINIIGQCTERLLVGEDLRVVMRDHHRAQVALGVVPQEVQCLIAEIEGRGGSAKVIGAGARTGGGGMVLVLPSAVKLA